MSLDIVKIDKIQLKRANASTWTSLNPVLLDGEAGYERDSNKLKIGDGIKDWATLNYIDSLAGSNLSVLSDIISSTPTNKNFLIATGTAWTSRAATLADISDYSSAKIQTDLDTNLGQTRWRAIEVPAGGSTGQILKKLSGSNYDVGWAAPVVGLNSTDIDTISKLNALVTDATFIDTGDSRLSDARTPLAHTHVAADITDFSTSVTNNASVTDNTAKVSADGSIATHSDVDLTGIANNYILKWNSTNSRFEPTVDATGAAGTNLAYTPSPTNGIVTSDTGTDATLSLAGGINAGLMSPSDYTKLSNISGTNTGDQTTIVGITGTKAQFNTAVTDGTIMYVGDAPTSHTHVLADITNFTETNYPLLTGTRKFTGDLSVSVTGSSTTTPRILGFVDFSGSAAARLQFGDQYNAVQSGNGTGMDMYCYNSIRIRGSAGRDGTVGKSVSLVDTTFHTPIDGVAVSLETSWKDNTIRFKGATSQASPISEWVTVSNTRVASVSPTGSVTALSFIKTGATSDDVLLGNGTTTSLAGITGTTPVADTPTTTITLDNIIGRYSNMGAANTNTTFSIAASPVLGGKCKMLINAATEPVVNNPDASAARKLAGVAFIASTNMYLHVEWLGATRKADYFFTKIA